jgi:hypothetical protein
MSADADRRAVEQRSGKPEMPIMPKPIGLIQLAVSPWLEEAPRSHGKPVESK